MDSHDWKRMAELAHAAGHDRFAAVLRIEADTARDKELADDETERDALNSCHDNYGGSQS